MEIRKKTATNFLRLVRNRRKKNISKLMRNFVILEFSKFDSGNSKKMENPRVLKTKQKYSILLKLDQTRQPGKTLLQVLRRLGNKPNNTPNEITQSSGQILKSFWLFCSGWRIVVRLCSLFDIGLKTELVLDYTWRLIYNFIPKVNSAI